MWELLTLELPWPHVAPWSVSRSLLVQGWWPAALLWCRAEARRWPAAGPALHTWCPLTLLPPPSPPALHRSWWGGSWTAPAWRCRPWSSCRAPTRRALPRAGCRPTWCSCGAAGRRRPRTAQTSRRRVRVPRLMAGCIYLVQRGQGRRQGRLPVPTLPRPGHRPPADQRPASSQPPLAPILAPPDHPRAAEADGGPRQGRRRRCRLAALLTTPRASQPLPGWIVVGGSVPYPSLSPLTALISELNPCSLQPVPRLPFCLPFSPTPLPLPWRFDFDCGPPPLPLSRVSMAFS